MYVEIGKDVGRAARTTQTGRVVAFPSGTSYGLAVDALQGHALQRLRNMKGRPPEKAFTIFLDEPLWDMFLRLTAVERMVLQRLRQQPLTLLVRPRPALAHLARADLVGLRVIDHPLMQGLAEAAAVPLTATSANISGEESCYSPADVRAKFPGRLDPNDTRYGDIARAGPTTYDLSLGYILDGGELSRQASTTVAKIVGSAVEIARAGALSAEDIAAARRK